MWINHWRGWASYAEANTITPTLPSEQNPSSFHPADIYKLESDLQVIV